MSTKKARRYQRGSISQSVNREIWYGKYYPEPGAPQRRVQLGRSSEIDEKQARVALHEIVAALNKSPSRALGGEPVRRFVVQVYVPQKYENPAFFAVCPTNLRTGAKMERKILPGGFP